MPAQRRCWCCRRALPKCDSRTACGFCRRVLRQIEEAHAMRPLTLDEYERQEAALREERLRNRGKVGTL